MPRTLAPLLLAALGAAPGATADPAAAAAAAFKLSSPELTAGGRFEQRHVFNGFGCTGGNVSPALRWSGAPAGTKSFALTVYDPDAPTGSGWWHWVVVDIPATMTELPRGWGKSGTASPGGGARQTQTDFGAPGYGGPCPPQGDKPHRYIFTIFAVKADKLDADENASGALIGFMLHFNTLATATITATYGR